MTYIIMNTHSSRGKVLYRDVLNLESVILRSPTITKSVEKQIENLELRLGSIQSDFEREAKLLIAKVPSNKRSNQNIVNKSNKVKVVRVSEMNGAINKIKKLVGVSAPQPNSVQPPTGASDLMRTLERVNDRLSKIGSRFED